jgi:hypothetical protein
MAFARPTVDSFNIAGSSSVKTSAVFIIDNTYSMSVVTDKGSFFNRAKKITEEILNEFEEGDELSIITVGVPAQQFTTSKLLPAKKELNDIELFPVSGSLENAFITASKILGQSKKFNREIYVLSDFQENRLKNLTDNEKSEVKLDENTKLYLVPFEDGELSNVTLSGLKTNNQIFEINKPVSFSALVVNNGSKPVNNSTLSLFINGERVSQKSFSLSPNQQKEIILETTINSAGLLEVTTELEDDDIIIDNTTYTSILIKEKVNVLIFYDNQNDIFFLEQALKNSGNSINVTSANSINRNRLQLPGYDVFFIIGINNVVNDEEFLNHLKENGKLIIMPGSNSNVINFSNFCKELGITQPSNAVGSFENKEVTTSIENINLNHPLFSSLFIDENKSAIESPEIKYYFKFPAQLRESKIISLIDGSPFLFEKTGSKIMVFNISPNLAWSDFPIKGIFAPLMNKCVGYISSNTSSQNNYLAGMPVDVKLSGLSSNLLKLEKPFGENEFINIDSLGNKNYYKYAGTKQTGIYKFYNSDELIDFAVVNIDAGESEIKIFDEDGVENFLKEKNIGENYFWIDPESDFKSVIYQSRFGSELWKYFLIAALILALIEMFIARSAKKDMVEFAK